MFKRKENMFYIKFNYSSIIFKYCYDIISNKYNNVCIIIKNWLGLGIQSLLCKLFLN